MPKTSSKWTCQECGYISPSYLGKCPECNSWGTLIEEIVHKKSTKSNLTDLENSFSSSASVNIENLQRIRSFDKENEYGPKGPTGVGVRTLINYLTNYA